MVYEASAETTRDVGIAKWGHATDDADGATIFRGYGRRNELLVEVRQTLLQVDDLTKRFEMKMTGPAGSGSERIEFVAQWAADGQTMDYVTNVRENTFVAGSPAAKILARLAPDAAAMAAKAPSTGAPSLTKSLRPLDEKPAKELVAPGETPLVECCSQLTRESAAASAAPGTECPLVTPSEQSLAAPQDYDMDLETGGGIGPRALVLGADGKPVVKSPWAGSYNIVDHHCHNAAAENSSKTDGYIACHATSSTTSTQGHTINWAPDPAAKAGAKGAYCAYEPQSNGGTLVSNSVCCWQGNAAADGSPKFDTTGAQGCVSKLCLGQADFPGWFRSWYVTPPKAFPAGSTPPVPNDCPGTTADKAACITCCIAQADNVSSLFGSAGEQYKKQVSEYRTRCNVACVDRDIARKAKTVAEKCLKAAIDASTAKATALTSCTSNKPKK